ncbi:MAG: bifunctional folylpolyglutamate synthase/dihydrofolate synthase [Bacteroidales bacterium]|nr:bifunctional folylpolyglutamate synthase/dihydrofolate synthase [Bacteroidales bacterium]
MTYDETLNYMFASLPMYHRIGAAAYKADIKPTVAFMAQLGNPERRFRCIHVAGTNGKGSVSHFLASTLQEAGYKVGLYTSPHLVDFRERIRVNGSMITRDAVVDFVEQHREAMEQLQLSFFEMTVGLAFDYFARSAVDVAVVEVGMGGRLDSTNVVHPDLSIITNIGMDHTQFLGITLPEIAREKAGIIKDEVPVVIGETQGETEPVFRAAAAAHHAPISFADQKWNLQVVGATVDGLDVAICSATGATTEQFHSPLAGAYQRKNLITVREAVEVLRTNRLFDISDTALRNGIARVQSNTHLRGRWQVIGQKPLTICETAHNADGVEAMLERIGEMRGSFKKLRIVYGCVSDKDCGKILSLIEERLHQWGVDAEWYFTQPSVQRRMPVERLTEEVAKLHIMGQKIISPKEALEMARVDASPDDLVLVTGSIFLVADVLGQEES